MGEKGFFSEGAGVSTGAGVGGWESLGTGDGGAGVAGSGAEVVARGAATGSAGVGSAVNMVVVVWCWQEAMFLGIDGAVFVAVGRLQRFPVKIAKCAATESLSDKRELLDK